MRSSSGSGGSGRKRAAAEGGAADAGSRSIADMFGVRKGKRARGPPGKPGQPLAKALDAAAAPSRPVKKLLPESPPPKEQAPVEQGVKKPTFVELPYRKELASLEAQDRSADKLPFNIFRTVHYESRGVSEDTVQTEYGKSPRAVFNSNPHNCAVFQFVRDNYEIPEDFDRNLKYGAQSGMCHEERVVSAYESGMLSLKDPAAAEVQMCRTCGDEGHLGWECPTLLESV